MTFTIKSIIASVSLFLAAASFYIGPALWRQGYTFYLGHTFCQHLGQEDASDKMQLLVKEALRDIDVPFWRLVQIKKTSQTSCSFAWHIWMNEGEKFGPLTYLAYHEAAHIACGHGTYRLYHLDITPEDKRAQEKEADLLAAQTLYKVGKQNVIFEVLAHIQAAIEDDWDQENHTQDHPSLQEMAVYFTKFLENKGYTNIDKEVKKRMFAVRKLWCQ